MDERTKPKIPLAPSEPHPDLSKSGAGWCSLSEDFDEDTPPTDVSSVVFWAVVAVVIGAAAYWWLA